MVLQHLNAILEGRFKAEMLATPFSVQVLFSKHKNSQIGKMMIALKEHSEWITTNKQLSTEKPISIQLSEELTKILEFSKPKQRNNRSPKCHANNNYQSDCDKD
jgi:hypothetical protein